MTEISTNWREVDAALKDLASLVGPRKAERVVQSAMNFAVGKASPLAKMAKALAPVGNTDRGILRTYKGNVKTPGFLSRNLDFKPIKKRNLVLFGPKVEAFYGTTFLERKVGRYGNRGPWLEPAFEATKAQTLQRLTDRLAKNIEKARNKALSK